MRKVVLALLLGWGIQASAWETFTHHTIYGTTDEPVIVSFTPGEVEPGVADAASTFNMQLRSVERPEIHALPDVTHDGETVRYNIHVTIPRTGHWFADIRACNEGGCSRWASMERGEDVANGQSKWIYGYVAPPTGGGVD